MKELRLDTTASAAHGAGGHGGTIRPLSGQPWRVAGAVGDAPLMDIHRERWPVLGRIGVQPTDGGAVQADSHRVLSVGTHIVLEQHLVSRDHRGMYRPRDTGSRIAIVGLGHGAKDLVAELFGGGCVKGIDSEEQIAQVTPRAMQGGIDGRKPRRRQIHLATLDAELEDLWSLILRHIRSRRFHRRAAWPARADAYSHSMVAGGLLETS